MHVEKVYIKCSIENLGMFEESTRLIAENYGQSGQVALWKIVFTGIIIQAETIVFYCL